MLLEDLHWIDSDSAAVINALRDVLPERHFVILGTTRSYPDLAVNFGPDHNHFELSALDIAAANNLLNNLLGGGKGLSRLKERLLEKTGGIPLFLEEVVRSLIDTGALIGSPGDYSLTVSPEEVGIPVTVQAIISTRVDALPANPKRVLQSAAVLGQPITMPLLATMTDAPANELWEAIRWGSGNRCNAGGADQGFLQGARRGASGRHEDFGATARNTKQRPSTRKRSKICWTASYRQRFAAYWKSALRPASRPSKSLRSSSCKRALTVAHEAIFNITVPSPAVGPGAEYSCRT